MNIFLEIRRNKMVTTLQTYKQKEIQLQDSETTNKIIKDISDL